MKPRASVIRRRLSLLCALAGLTLTAAAAQERLDAASPAAAVQPAPRSDSIGRTVILYYFFAPDAEFSPIERRLLSESLIIRLGSTSAEIRLSQVPLGELPSAEELDQSATSSGADAWLLVTIAGTMSAASLHFQARDIPRNRDFFVVDINGEIDSRFRNAFGGLWQPVERKMQETIKPFRQFNTLSILGPANASLQIEGLPPVALDANGQASLQLESPASYRYSLYLPGYRAFSGSIFMEQDAELKLEPPPRLPIAVSLGLEWLAFPVLGVELNLIPDRLGIETQAVMYGLGLTPSAPGASSFYLIKDYGLLNFLIGLRWQVLGHQWPLQVSLGAGAQIRYLTTDYLRPDPLAPGGWYLLAGASIDLLPELCLFADLVPRFAISSDTALLQSAQGRSRGSAGLGEALIIASPLVIEPLHFTVGLRWQP